MPKDHKLKEASSGFNAEEVRYEGESLRQGEREEGGVPEFYSLWRLIQDMVAASADAKDPEDVLFLGLDGFVQHNLEREGNSGKFTSWAWARNASRRGVEGASREAKQMALGIMMDWIADRMGHSKAVSRVRAKVGAKGGGKSKGGGRPPMDGQGRLL